MSAISATSATAEIPLARPLLGSAEINAAERVLRSGRLVIGPENARFEQELAERTGRAHAVAVTSGTTALELTLWALGVGDGDEVIISAFGFPAAVNAVLRMGARPVAVDVDPGTWNTTPDGITAARTDKTKAVVSIDQLGLTAEAAGLRQVCAQHDLLLIDDAACAFGGCDSAQVPGGGYGVAGTLSFHPRKVITTGEGGAIVTDDPELDTALRRLRNQGQAGRGVFDRIGTNARLGEINAAVGCAQLVRLDEMLAERRLLATGYRERLANVEQAGRLSWQQVPDGAMHTHQTLTVLLAEGVRRDAVCAQLTDAGIESGPATYAFTRLDSFASVVDAAKSYPVADALHERLLALPLYCGMRSAELDRVCDVLSEAVDEQA